MPESIVIVARPHKGDFRLRFRSDREEEHVTVTHEEASSIVHAAYEAGYVGYREDFATVVLKKREAHA